MIGTKYLNRSPSPEWTGTFWFDTNGTSDPSLTTVGGSLARYVSSITYSATGLYTIVMTEDFNLPADGTIFMVSAQMDSLAESFIPIVLDKWVYTTRTLKVQTCTHDGSATNDLVGIAIAAPGSAGLSRVIVRCIASATSGA